MVKGRNSPGKLRTVSLGLFINGIRGIPGKFSLWVERLSEGHFCLLLLSPLILLLTVIIGVPLLGTIWVSFHQYAPTKPWLEYKFTGLANYISLLTDPIFFAALLHSFYFTVLNIVFMLLFAMMGAFLASKQTKGKAIIRTALLVPWATPIAIAGITFKLMYSSEYGVINYLLKSAGFIEEYIPWLLSYSHVFNWMYSAVAMNAVIVAAVWRNIPISTLLLLAALESIPSEYYKVAKVNGANTWQIFRHITLPLIMPAITVVVLWRAITAMRIYGIIETMTGGGPGRLTETLQLLTIRTFFTAKNIGKGSAIATMTMIFTFLIILAYLVFIQYMEKKRK